MAGPARLRAILPKEQISALYPPARIRKWLTEVGEEFRKEMKFYPPKVRGSSYRRTRRYRRGWDKPLIIGPASVQLLNDVRYARYVGGPTRSREGRAGQSRLLASRGWPSQSEVGPRVARKNLPRLRKLILPLRNPR